MGQISDNFITWEQKAAANWLEPVREEELSACNLLVLSNSHKLFLYRGTRHASKVSKKTASRSIEIILGGELNHDQVSQVSLV